MEEKPTLKSCSHFFTFAKVIVSLVCTIIFVLLMTDVWEKFNSRMTNTATQFIENKKDVEKFLPSVSVCPLPAFKKPGLFYSYKLFQENAFDLVFTLDLRLVLVRLVIIVFNDLSIFSLNRIKFEIFKVFVQTFWMLITSKKCFTILSWRFKWPINNKRQKLGDHPMSIETFRKIFSKMKHLKIWKTFRFFLSNKFEVWFWVAATQSRSWVKFQHFIWISTLDSGWSLI